jgi:hypothetical protein
MKESYGGGGENRHGGFHNRGRQTPHEGHGGSGQGRMAPAGGKHKHMSEPTNHAGHTYGMHNTHAHNARVEATRGIHTGKQMDGHERILHETHKLHQTDGHFSHGTKHGESHHVREETAGHVRETGKELE